MPTIPPSLLKLQQQFGEAISTPLELLDEDANFRMRTEHYDLSLVKLLVPREDLGLSGMDRLATYNQQYWFRLLSTMQEEYPLLARLTGPGVFAQLVMDYLQQFPSNSASLRDLSRLLVTYMSMDSHYNRASWVQAAELEYLYIHAFDAGRLPVLDLSHLSPEQQVDQLALPIRFQPDLRLFSESWNLVELRMLARSENDPEGPILIPAHAQHHWAIYRKEHYVTAEAIGVFQYQLLDALMQGKPLEDAVNHVVEQTDDHGRAFMQERLTSWFDHWRRLGWFAQPDC
ncbi:MAG TPA: hypothetical protein DCM28_22165 [Phycisphaerales bacterium]|nr:hypothetical protein [Phycisphaerales bacterium]HCD33179.1 hypothetical protein [Phycisphaerales bacterium]|tara:strand:+ start:989 stop:1849 length:861 start_codon:yes stop_codon:yes gene_type:complete